MKTATEMQLHAIANALVIEVVYALEDWKAEHGDTDDAVGRFFGSGKYEDEDGTQAGKVIDVFYDAHFDLFPELQDKDWDRVLEIFTEHMSNEDYAKTAGMLAKNDMLDEQKFARNVSSAVVSATIH